MKRLLVITMTILVPLAVVLTYQACGQLSGKGFQVLESDGGQSLASSDLKSSVLDILEKNCASCHDSKNTSGTALNYVNDLNKLAISNYVVLGDPSSSQLYQVIIDGQMPLGAPLSSAEAGVIYDWIKSLRTAPTPSPTPTPTPTPTPNMATYAYISKNILQPKCVGCHGSSGGYSFSSYANTLKAVTAGKANISPLYTSTSGGRMPTNGKLSTQEIQAIFDWIQAGALNN